RVPSELTPGQEAGDMPLREIQPPSPRQAEGRWYRYGGLPERPYGDSRVAVGLITDLTPPDEEPTNIVVVGLRMDGRVVATRTTAMRSLEPSRLSQAVHDALEHFKSDIPWMFRLRTEMGDWAANVVMHVAMGL